jgi:DNA helicase II / ATP-dependent DNA helicase PcrA
MRFPVSRSLLRHFLHHTLKEAGESKSFPDPLDPQEAWQEADYLKRSEEYRLLYVAMTRAKRLLWMAAEQEAPFSWNNPDRRKEADPTPIVPMLQQHFKPLVKATQIKT